MTLSKTNNLTVTNPELVKEWDHKKNKKLFNLTPYDVTKSDKRKVCWICKTCNHPWRAVILTRAMGRKTGCPECGKKKRVESFKRNLLAKKMRGQKPITDFK